MARVAVACRDLLFGSRLESGLRGAGHEIVPAEDAELIVVDLTDPDLDGLSFAGGGARTLGFYSHVDVETRRAAEAAGFDLVVPRSRMARELPVVVEKALA